MQEFLLTQGDDGQKVFGHWLLDYLILDMISKIWTKKVTEIHVRDQLVHVVMTSEFYQISLD